MVLTYKLDYLHNKLSRDVVSTAIVLYRVKININ